MAEPDGVRAGKKLFVPGTAIATNIRKNFAASRIKPRATTERKKD